MQSLTKTVGLPFVALTLAAAAFAASSTTDWPTGNRTTPPTINSVSPRGVPRGATTELTVEGLNLARANAVFFSEPGVTARILRIKELPDLSDVRLGSNGGISTVDLGPLPPRNEVTLELNISAGADIGPVDFRLQTPLGTSPAARFLIEPYYGESADREPNDTPEDAVEVYTPAILVGAISKPGDIDYYKITVHAGEQLVFENGAAMLGSTLQPVVSIYDAGQNLVKQYGLEGGRSAQYFAHRFEKAGPYYVKISDYAEDGNARHFYRIKVGKFPLVLSAYPPGVRNGQTTQIALTGYNLGAGHVSLTGEPSPEDESSIMLRPKIGAGKSFNKVKLALDAEPEVEASAAHSIQAPVIINGRLLTDKNDFRFKARKGEKLVLEVNANRLGSPLDSMLEVLDSNGNPVERATIRCELATAVTLNDPSSSSDGIRIVSWTGMAVGDTLMVGSELIKVRAMPRGPDDDIRFESFEGERLGLLDTTPEAHAIDTPVYKVRIHPAGAAFVSNGMPVVHLTYRNDDGGPGYGKDSRLRFTAPADGEYIVRLRDVRGLHGEDYFYRLAVRPAAPDFRLSVEPRNPNVPVGGRIPVTVTALRLDDFDGPIDVAMEDLPAGLSAARGVIEPGQVSTTLLLNAADNARLETAAPLKVRGQAREGARQIAHWANPEDKLKFVALMPRPDITMQAKTREVVLEPGKTAKVEVAIERHNNFGGRVPVEVYNLPPGVLVTDVGLNGVLIHETENQVTFTLQALPNAAAADQPIVLSGNIETRADQQSEYASEPIALKVLAKK
ncbi:MAG TPA: hypothetical protein VKR61_03115 [Bryobacteraceae bacterium]|nr:hypothetical protein [Bryobacteraceae bacterium]